MEDAMNKWTVLSVIIFILCAPLLVFVLTQGYENILVYILYTVSAVSLGGTVWAAVIAGKTIKDARPLDRLGTKDERKILFFRLSLMIAFAYGIFKLVLGAYLSSGWLALTSLYYFALAFTRLYVVKHLDGEWRMCIKVGAHLLVLNTFASAIISYVVILSHSIVYPGFAIYVIAAWTFYFVISAIVGMVRLRKNLTPVNFCIASVKQSGSLVSLFIMQTAMISTFGDEPNFKRLMGAITGFFVVLLILAISIALIVNGVRREKGIEKIGG